MTRLQLTQAVARFLGTEDPDNITSTTSPSTDYQEDIVTAVDIAWEELQTLHDSWLWRRVQGTLSTVASTRTYAFSAIDASCIDVFPFVGGRQFHRYWLIGSNEVGFVPYQNFRGWLDRGTRAEKRPEYFTIHPDETIEFDGTPDDAYTVDLDYLTSLDTFSADGDTPTGLPSRFHRIILYSAALRLAEYDENAFRFQTAQRRYNNFLKELEDDQLPDTEIQVQTLGERSTY